jgi:cysteine desulfurase
LSIGFPGVTSAPLIISLNNKGISVSDMSACKSGWIKNSHVLEAIDSDTENYGILRFSFGLKTEEKDLDYLFSVLQDT